MFLISAMVKGVFWGAAAVEPVIQMLGLGSIFAAWNVASKSNLYDDFFIKSESKTTEEDEIKPISEIKPSVKKNDVIEKEPEKEIDLGFDEKV